MCTADWSGNRCVAKDDIKVVIISLRVPTIVGMCDHAQPCESGLSVEGVCCAGWRLALHHFVEGRCLLYRLETGSVGMRLRVCWILMIQVNGLLCQSLRRESQEWLLYIWNSALERAGAGGL